MEWRAVDHGGRRLILSSWARPIRCGMLTLPTTNRSTCSNDLESESDRSTVPQRSPLGVTFTRWSTVGVLSRIALNPMNFRCAGR
jgi:hypothetical protein